MIHFIIRLLINALALYAVPYIDPGVHLATFQGAILAALVLGIVNAVLRPILILLSLPLEILTLGLFTLVINAVLFYLVAAVHVGGLTVDGFGAAFIGALILTVVSFLMSWLLGGRKPAEGSRTANP